MCWREDQLQLSVATRSPARTDLALCECALIFRAHTPVVMPGFPELVESLRYTEPTSASRSPVLTDDFAPVEGLAASGDHPQVKPRGRTP